MLALTGLATILPEAAHATAITSFPGTWCDAAKKLRYDYTDSTAGGIAFNFVDLSVQTANFYPFAYRDDFTGNSAPLPFAFTFFGTTYNSFMMDSNGVMGFSGDFLQFPNSNTNTPKTSLPTAAAPQAVIAALWNDLDLSDPGQMLFQQVGSAFIIEWQNGQASNGGYAPPPGVHNPPYNFEIKLFADHHIEVHYKQTYDDSAALQGKVNLIGIESAFDSANAWQGGLYKQSHNVWVNYAVKYSPIFDAAPTAFDDVFAATQGTPLTVTAGTQPGLVAAAPLYYISTAGGVLANDRDELPCATKTAQLVTGIPAGQGTLSLAANGGFTYDPGSFCGTTSFTYRVLDPAGTAGGVAYQSAPATVTLNVACLPNQPPTAVCTVSPAGPYGAGQTVTFSAASSSDPDGTVAAYDWTFPSGSPATSTAATQGVTWSAPGTSTPTLRVRDNGGQWSATVNCPAITIPAGPANQPPTASDALYQVPMGTTFSSSASPQGGLSNFASDPENAPLTFSPCPPTLAGLSLSNTGSFTYTAGNSPATLTFQYRVSDGSLTSACATVTLQVMANVRPTARFTASPSSAHVGDLVSFTDASTDPDVGDGVAAWRWTFGDGATATGRNPSHAYGAPGTYTVCLVVDDTKGAPSTPFCSTIGVSQTSPSQAPPSGGSGPQPEQGEPPQADGDAPGTPLHVTLEGPAQAEPGSVVDLTAHADGSAATTFSWQVLQGDAQVTAQGATATLQLPASASGPIYVAVTAHDGAATGSAGLTVTPQAAAGAPVASIAGPSSAPAGSDVVLDASASHGVGALTYHWTQTAGPAATVLGGDTATPTLRLPATPGTVVVLLSVQDGQGSATATRAITVTASGQHDDAPADDSLGGFVLQTQGRTVRLTPAVAADGYDWTFGDGQTGHSTGAVTHTYADAGSYDIQLSTGSKQYVASATIVAPEDRSAGAADLAAGGPLGTAWLPYVVGALVVVLAAAMVLALSRRRSPPIA